MSRPPPSGWPRTRQQHQQQERDDGEQGDGPTAEMPAITEDEQDEECQPEDAGAEDARVGPGGQRMLEHKEEADDDAGRQQRKGPVDGAAVHLFKAFEAGQAEAVAGQRFGPQLPGAERGT